MRTRLSFVCMSSCAHMRAFNVHYTHTYVCIYAVVALLYAVLCKHRARKEFGIRSNVRCIVSVRSAWPGLYLSLSVAGRSARPSYVCVFLYTLECEHRKIAGWDGYELLNIMRVLIEIPINKLRMFGMCGCGCVVALCGGG